MFPAEASRRFSSPHLTLLVILLQAWEHKVAGDAATVPQGDQLIQLAYADAIQPFLATTLGEKEAVYVCPLSQAGIAAGNWVPDEVTNGQIYTAGDYLLPRDTPVFIPGSGSYTKTLQTYVSCVRAHLETSLMHAASPTYLSYVELNKNPVAGEKIRFTAALDEANKQADAFAAARIAAIAAFNKDPDKGIGFSAWVNKYDTKYVRAFNANQAAAGNLKVAMAKYWGPLAAQLNQDRDRLELAMSPSSSYTSGTNMAVTFEDLSTIQANYDAATAGSDVKVKVDGTFPAPDYHFSAGSYEETVTDWVQGYDTVKPTEIEIDISNAASKSWEQKGFKKITAGISVSYWTFLRATATFESTEETRNLDASRASSEIKLTLKCHGKPTKFDIAQGNWDIKNLAGVYPNLIPGAPANLIPSMVQVKSLLLAYGCGMSVQFSGETLKEAHTLISTSIKTGGSLSFFGWNIGLSASGSYEQTQSTTFDQVTWDATSGRFELPPVDNGYPVLLGVLGERLK